MTESSCGCHGDTTRAERDPAYRRALLTVVILNLGFGAIELAGGFAAASQALKADSLDFLGDGSISLLGLLALTWTTRARAQVALTQGVFLGLLGLGVIGFSIWRAFHAVPPEAALMGGIGIVALAVNVVSALLLARFREGDANVRAIWLFSRNDAIANIAVILAAGVIVWTGSAWPDLVVAAAIAGLFLHSSYEIVRGALAELAPYLEEGVLMSFPATAHRQCLLAFFFAALALVLAPTSARAAANPNEVQTAWRLLDYIAVDYDGAVSDGRITSPSEYAEMTEFSASAAAKIAALPANPQRQELVDGVARLQRLIADKAPKQDVAQAGHGLAAALLAAYPVPLAPANAPSFARGKALYAQNCAACHGIAGDGHGPNAASLSTPPIAFTDRARAEQRSIFALYQVITQGIDGTAMPSWDSLPSQDRWALAFYAGHFAFTDQQVSEGKHLWASGPSLHKLVPDLKTLAGLRPATLAKTIGQDKADAVFAYLRRHPDAVVQQPSGSLDLVRTRLADSLAAYRAGQRKQAQDLALSAYLDGFEPIEPTLGARDATLMTRIESEMGQYRAAIGRDVSADDATRRVQILNGLFDDAEAALASNSGSELTTFVGAATILLREGLEALLIVVAMIAFLRKAERVEVLPYVHGGWISALTAGVATWAVATYAIGISGASRELTEGFGSIFAAVVLLSVGIWMHGKAQADQWQRYIRDKMTKALTGRSAWLLFGLAFIVVYREVFETILFYAALWTQGNGGAMLAGAGVAVAALAIIAWAMLRYSRDLPIAKFFNYSAWLMAVLTVVLAGKGVAALQEAGIINIAPLVAAPRVSLLGIFPTVQSLAAQAAMLIAIALGFSFNRRKATSQTSDATR